MSAYALLDRNFKSYQKKTEELYGEGASIRIREEVAKDDYEEDAIKIEEGKELFYDMYSNRYFQSTLYDVQQAEYRLNRNLFTRDYAYLNEFYEELGKVGMDDSGAVARIAARLNRKAGRGS